MNTLMINKDAQRTLMALRDEVANRRSKMNVLSYENNSDIVSQMSKAIQDAKDAQSTYSRRPQYEAGKALQKYLEEY